MSKPFYQSKTFWFNILFGVIAIASLFGWVDYQPTQDVVDIVAVVIAAIGLVLRFVTKEPIGWK